uniref:G-protein coupled receptors family 1 profile domain-containing protein n=1 Tax=Romanomermis culicivorax TaxID=13658 RepID=A0A915IHA4_ROMCU
MENETDLWNKSHAGHFEEIVLSSIGLIFSPLVASINILAFRAVLKTKEYSKHFSTILAGYLLCRAFICVMYCLISLLTMIFIYYPHWSFMPLWTCHVIIDPYLFAECYNTYCMLVISIERLYSIVRPLKFKLLTIKSALNLHIILCALNFILTTGFSYIGVQINQMVTCLRPGRHPIPLWWVTFQLTVDFGVIFSSLIFYFSSCLILKRKSRRVGQILMVTVVGDGNIQTINQTINNKYDLSLKKIMSIVSFIIFSNSVAVVYALLMTTIKDPLIGERMSKYSTLVYLIDKLIEPVYMIFTVDWIKIYVKTYFVKNV